MKTASDNALSFLSAVMLTLVFIGSYACQAKPRLHTSSEDDNKSLGFTVVLLIGAILVIGVATMVTFVLRMRELRTSPARTAPHGTTSLDTQLLPPLAVAPFGSNSQTEAL